MFKSDDEDDDSFEDVELDFVIFVILNYKYKLIWLKKITILIII